MAINHTDSETWSIDDIISALGESPNKKKKIKIPKFQRTLVWNKRQQKAFIDSIKQGFPVGAILLYKMHEINAATIYSLIDGLQRSTALNQYIKAPTQFFDEINIPDGFINDLYSQIYPLNNDITEENLSKVIIAWVTALQGFKEPQGFSAYKLSRYIEEECEVELDREQLEKHHSLFVPFLAGIEEEANINQFKIPILIYTGEQSNLPLIFERLNSKGTQLSKYQIYAATWVTYPHFKIGTRDIIAGIKNKYDSLLEEGYEVENYDSSPKFYTSEFSLFEYLFGFGKYLCTKFEYLFSGSNKTEQEDSIGFNIMNICLDLPVSKMNEIPKKFEKHDVKNLEKAIISSVEFVFDCLKGYITLKMNKRKKISIAHSELQIVSMIGKVFHSKYDKNLNEKDDWSDCSRRLQENLAYHYLYDIIREFWRGSGDSKAYNLIRSERYETAIKKSQWESVFNDWFETDLLKKEKLRINIKESTILFYKYIYNQSLTAFEEMSNSTYDIEHLVPVEKLKDIAGNGIPISAFPNICLLDESLNRTKGSLTFYQFFDKKVIEEELTLEQSVIEIEEVEKYTHTKRDDLKFVEDDFNIDNYKKFLETRFETVKELFFMLNNIDT